MNSLFLEKQTAKTNKARRSVPRRLLVTLIAIGWNDAGPEAEAILSYSQSGDPESPHFDDQTQLYAQKTWRPIRFTQSDIEAHTTSRRVLRSID